MPARIEFRDALGRERTVALRDDPVYIGRAQNCAIRTDDAGVSVVHAVIRRHDGRYWVEDLESESGTEVDGVRTPRHMLAHGETIRCGSLSLRYVEYTPAVRVTPPSGRAAAANRLSSPVLVPVAARDQPEALLAEIEALREYIEELRQELERANQEQQRMAAEIERLRSKLGE